MDTRSILPLLILTPIAFGGASATAQTEPPDNVYQVGLFLHLNYENNVVLPSNAYALELSILCSPNVTGVTLQPPVRGPVALVKEEGTWQEDSDLIFNDKPTGTYVLTFSLAGAGTEAVSVAFFPPDPNGLAQVTFPIPGSSCTPLDPVFTWNSTALGTTLFLEVQRLSTGDEIAATSLSSTETSWNPGLSLAPGESYNLDIALGPWSSSSVSTTSGDELLYVQGMLAQNAVTFSACDSVTPLSIPVTAFIKSSTGTGIEEIGTIVATQPGGASVEATFTFAAPFGQLDKTYDLHWVNIEREYAILPPSCGGPVQPNCGQQASDPNPSGHPLGILPAIDPAPGFDDSVPFYFTAAEEATGSCASGPIYVPFASTSFCDARADASTNSVINFQTLLVATSTKDPQFGPKTFCVLGGFDWIYENDSQQASVCGATSPSSTLANVALDNAPAFSDWAAAAGCLLTNLPNPFVSLGQGLGGAHGTPALEVDGTLVPGWPVSFSLTGALENSPAHFIIGASALTAPFKGGVMVPFPHVVVSLTTSPAGAIGLNGIWPSEIPSGVESYYQWWIKDLAGPAGFSASNAVSAQAP